MKTTIGDLPANAIGRDHVVIQHDGSTLSGLLTALQIDSELITDQHANGDTRSYLAAVHVTATIGSITIGPLERTHACQVIA